MHMGYYAPKGSCTMQPVLTHPNTYHVLTYQVTPPYHQVFLACQGGPGEVCCITDGAAGGLMLPGDDLFGSLAQLSEKLPVPPAITGLRGLPTCTTDRPTPIPPHVTKGINLWRT